MADHRGDQVESDKLLVVASFCYLGDMLSAANGCKPLEEIQGAATSSLFLPPVFQDMWLRVQLLCVEGNAPCL